MIGWVLGLDWRLRLAVAAAVAAALSMLGVIHPLVGAAGAALAVLGSGYLEHREQSALRTTIAEQGERIRRIDHPTAHERNVQLDQLQREMLSRKISYGRSRDDPY